MCDFNVVEEYPDYIKLCNRYNCVELKWFNGNLYLYDGRSGITSNVTYMPADRGVRYIASLLC